MQSTARQDTTLSKRFLQSEVLGEVCVLEGGQSRVKFLAKFGAKFLAKFSGLFCWYIQREKTPAKTSAQNSHGSAQQTLQKSGKNFMMRFCREPPANTMLEKPIFVCKGGFGQ